MVDEESAAVLEALRSLPERQRACLVLHYYEELSIAEVAEGIHAYGVASHRHAPEIEQGLSAAAGLEALSISFSKTMK